MAALHLEPPTKQIREGRRFLRSGKYIYTNSLSEVDESIYYQEWTNGRLYSICKLSDGESAVLVDDGGELIDCNENGILASKDDQLVLYSLDGNALWTYNEYPADTNSARFVGDNVLVPVHDDGSAGWYLASLDAKTGQRVAETFVGTSWTSNGRTVFCSDRDGLHLMDAVSGENLFDFDSSAWAVDTDSKELLVVEENSTYRFFNEKGEEIIPHFAD